MAEMLQKSVKYIIGVLSIYALCSTFVVYIVGQDNRNLKKQLAEKPVVTTEPTIKTMVVTKVVDLSEEQKQALIKKHNIEMKELNELINDLQSRIDVVEYSGGQTVTPVGKQEKQQDNTVISPNKNMINMTILGNGIYGSYGRYIYKNYFVDLAIHSQGYYGLGITKVF